MNGLSRTLLLLTLLGPPAARGDAPGGLEIDPCTVPDLGGGERWTNGVSAFEAIVTDLSTARVVSIADGISGYRSGAAVRLKIDLRDGSGARPSFSVAVHVSVIGTGFVRPAGKTYRCKDMDFFWRGSGDAATRDLGIEEIEFIVGDRAAVAGLVPDDTMPGLVKPLWMITERLRMTFGRTDPDEDRQEGIRDVEYPIRPERIGASRNPDPTRRTSDRLELLGPSLESDYTPIVDQPVRRFVAIREYEARSDVLTAYATTQSDDGTLVTRREPVLLRRLGRTKVFVGSFIVIPEGWWTRFLRGSIVRAEVGTTGKVIVELADEENR